MGKLPIASQSRRSRSSKILSFGKMPNRWGKVGFHFFPSERGTSSIYPIYPIFLRRRNLRGGARLGTSCSPPTACCELTCSEHRIGLDNWLTLCCISIFPYPIPLARLGRLDTWSPCPRLPPWTEESPWLWGQPDIPPGSRPNRPGSLPEDRACVLLGLLSGPLEGKGGPLLLDWT